jgi:pyruvate/2-oxoacid:ferredoxin oxidoreductase alpha subunit
VSEVIAIYPITPSSAMHRVEYEVRLFEEAIELKRTERTEHKVLQAA